MGVYNNPDAKTVEEIKQLLKRIVEKESVDPEIKLIASALRRHLDAEI